MKIGIIGTGHMGGMLARAFAETSSECVYVYNRTAEKAEAVAADFTNMAVCNTWRSLVSCVDAVILCTKAADGFHMMQQLGPALSRNQLLLTTISSIDLDQWQEFTPATPVKLIPSLTQTVHKGALLVSYPRTISPEDKLRLEQKLSAIGRPYVIDEAQVRVCSDLTSCGPAFLTSICQSWAQAAAQTGNIDRAEAESLLASMITGLAALLEAGMTFEQVIDQIRVPGGVTELGLEALGDGPLQLFTRLHAETARYANGHKRNSVPSPLASRQV